MTEMRTLRLTVADRELARASFAMMASVFDEPNQPLSNEYLERLLSREDYWLMAAVAGAEVIGGLSAHALPMTRSESTELFIYDVAVRQDHQRRGVGRRLLGALQEAAARAGIHELFVPASNDDTHALDFYRAVGGVPEAVTIFSFFGGSTPTESG